MTIRFLRNKVVEVNPQPDGSPAVSWRLTDDLLKAEVNLTVLPPDLEIVAAEAGLERLVPRAWSSAPELIKKIEGWMMVYYTSLIFTLICEPKAGGAISAYAPVRMRKDKTT